MVSTASVRTDVAYAAPMPSIVSHATAADGTDLLVRHWPADDVEAGGAWAGPAVGVGPARPRPRRAVRSLRARRRPARGGRARRRAYDQRGNGGSGGRRGDVDRWSQFHDDLGERLAAVRAAAERPPVVLYGHSMGGLVVAGYLPDATGPKPDLVVLSRRRRSIRRCRAGRSRLAASSAGSRRRCRSRTASIRPTLSRDPRSARRPAADPLNAHSRPRPASAPRRSPSRRASAPSRATARRPDARPPRRSTTASSRRRRPRSSTALPGVERRTFPGLRHERHNEPEGPAIIDEIVAWLRAERATV